MASYPSINFPNNEIPQTFNKNAFVSKALQSDNVLTIEIECFWTIDFKYIKFKYYYKYW